MLRFFRNPLAALFSKEKLDLMVFRYPLLHLVFFSFWFQLILTGIGLFAIALVIMLPRVWTTTPPGFKPVIKVRLLNLAQAWSLKRSAQKAMAAGQLDTAVMTWQQAVANNPANPKLNRGFFEAIIKCDQAKPQPQLVIGQALWLLRLTGTNQVNADLAAKLFLKYHHYEGVLDLLEPRAKTLSPVLSVAYLKALFNLGQMDQFARHWQLLDPNQANDPELRFYRMAYLAGWGPADTAAEGRRQLEAAQADPAWRELAVRLGLIVYLRQENVAGYEKNLRQLKEWHADNLGDNVLYWQLLDTNGKREQAVQLVRAFNTPPASAAELLLLANTHQSLGRQSQALQLMQRYAGQFAYAEAIWMTYAGLLIGEQRWPALLTLAMDMRKEKVAGDNLVGFSYYTEGRAHLAQQKRGPAEAAFRQIPEFTYRNPALVVEMGRNLYALGYPEIAKDLLIKSQPLCARSPLYWQLLGTVAHLLKLTDLRLTAYESAYQLNPQDWVAMNNYAAVLITQRQRPQEAIKLTVQLLAHAPNSVPAKINHSMALLANQRTTEAVALLQTINLNGLSPEETTAYYLGMLEANVNQRRYALARQDLAKIDRQHLFANQRQWLEQVRQQIEAAQ